MCQDLFGLYLTRIITVLQTLTSSCQNPRLIKYNSNAPHEQGSNLGVNRIFDKENLNISFSILIFF